MVGVALRDVPSGRVGFWFGGGPNNGFQGGVLEITATLFPVGGAPVTRSITVNCLINAPGGFTGDEGTAVGAFTERTGGQTFFHLNS
jgi:hypothetical protein